MSLTLLSLAASSSAGTAVSQGYATTLASMVGGLILVLVVIFVLAYVVRRLNLVPASGGAIKTLAASPMGQREKLVLVELDGQQYLVGVTSQQITLIDKLEKPVSISDSSFAGRLKLAKDKQS
ncbi:flagellar biosynthetic protein FliO [Shewanella sp.]|uniref:flagellar biosynthetic protein FliO n=1 Tax=Shewanella sp. TaxID=50422 RepID=UPI00356230D6